MPSAFESCLVRLQATDGGSGLKSLVDHLSIGSASSIRSASRTLYGLREVETKAFQAIYIPTPPNQKQCVGDLGNVGQYCNHLIIRIAFPTLTTKIKPTGQTIRKLLAEPKHRQAHEACLISRHSQHSTPELPVAWKFFLQRRPSEINQVLLKQWLLVFSLFPNITILTIACNGDPAWPGCTDIEMLLIVLRICIERTDPAKLRTICLNPIHAMGIMHFRWAGAGAYGEAPGSRNNVWQKVESLYLRIVNPFIQERLSKSQQQTFRGVLHDYLQSFSRTLIKLNFCWLEDYGPDPLLLDFDGPATKWPFLRELSISGVADSDAMVAKIRAGAPALRRVTGLVCKHGADDVGALRDVTIWKELLEASINGSETARASLLQLRNGMGCSMRRS